MYLSKSRLRNARFNNANLSGADLSAADLRGSEFVNTDLRGADLSGADLTRAKFDHSIFDEETLLTRADVTGTDFSKTTGLSERQLSAARHNPGRPPERPAQFLGASPGISDNTPRTMSTPRSRTETEKMRNDLLERERKTKREWRRLRWTWAALGALNLALFTIWILMQGRS